MSLTNKWRKLLENANYAFQPIVDIHTGKTYGVEALIRNYEKAKFRSIDDIFDTAVKEQILYKIDIKLREIAIRKFSKITFANKIRIFYNIDNRLEFTKNFNAQNTKNILEKLNLTDSNICFEISEKTHANFNELMNFQAFSHYKNQNYNIAIDDFGVGLSGFKLLYYSEPDFIKIDKFFIYEISKNTKKQLFVQSIVKIAQNMGIKTIAEGIESKEDFITCKALGCNMAQGFYIQKPTLNIENIKKTYKEIYFIHQKEQRKNNISKEISKKIEKLEPINHKSDIEKMLDVFRKNATSTRLIPVVDDNMRPKGVIYETDLKTYSFSSFGWSLLFNKTKGNIKKIISRCGIADINDNLDKIIDAHSSKQNSQGVLITKNEKYYGYLSSRVLLDLIYERNILNAKDQNPLTGLSGNNIINEFLSVCLSSTKKSVIIYFDIDNFKPYNDFYGFRNGDRVIKLFAEILDKESKKIPASKLVGHIGGDDFFLGINTNENISYDYIYNITNNILSKFKNDVESFYDKKDRELKFIIAKNRQGVDEKFSLTTISAALLLINPKKSKSLTNEEITQICSKLKKTAKLTGNAISSGSAINSPTLR